MQAEKAGELTEEKVAAMIGEDWTIDVMDTDGATTVSINWAERQINTENRINMMGMKTEAEWYGHVSLYDLPNGHHVTPDFILRQIADEAEEIADVAEGYESTWNGRNFVAVFNDASPEDLLVELSSLDYSDPDVCPIWGAEEWLDGNTLSDLYDLAPLVLPGSLPALAKALAEDALSQGAWINEQCLLAVLKRMDEDEREPAEGEDTEE